MKAVHQATSLALDAPPPFRESQLGHHLWRAGWRPTKQHGNEPHPRWVHLQSGAELTVSQAWERVLFDRFGVRATTKTRGHLSLVPTQVEEQNEEDIEQARLDRLI